MVGKWVTLVTQLYVKTVPELPEFQLTNFIWKMGYFSNPSTSMFSYGWFCVEVLTPKIISLSRSLKLVSLSREASTQVIRCS